jgi:hypothetical protein
MSLVASEYYSITPLLHVGDWCPFTTNDVRSARMAARLITNGHAVLVKDIETAKRVMSLLGMTDEEIEQRLRVVGLSDGG